CGTQESGADLTPADTHLRPEVADAAVQWQQSSPGDGLRSKQRAERDEAGEGRRSYHDEPTAADETDLRFGGWTRGAVLRLTRLGTSFTNIRPGHSERSDRVPAQPAGAVQVAAGTGDSAGESRPECRGKLAADHARAFRQQCAQRAQDCQRHQRQPVEQQGRGWRVDEATVQLRRTGDAGSLRHGDAAAAEQLRTSSGYDS